MGEGGPQRSPGPQHQPRAMTNPSPAFSPAPAAAFDCEAQIRELVHESQSHPAVNHPWLTTMARAAFSDPVGALKQFAIQYHGYTSWFPHYLRSVIRRLDREDLVCLPSARKVGERFARLILP